MLYTGPVLHPQDCFGLAREEGTDMVASEGTILEWVVYKDLVDTNKLQLHDGC